jgi:hypothetical protein
VIQVCRDNLDNLENLENLEGLASLVDLVLLALLVAPVLLVVLDGAAEVDRNSSLLMMMVLIVVCGDKAAVDGAIVDQAEREEREVAEELERPADLAFNLGATGVVALGHQIMDLAALIVVQRRVTTLHAHLPCRLRKCTLFYHCHLHSSSCYEAEDWCMSNAFDTLDISLDRIF